MGRLGILMLVSCSSYSYSYSLCVVLASGLDVIMFTLNLVWNFQIVVLYILGVAGKLSIAED